VTEYSFEVVPREGPAAEWRVWFVGSGAPVAARLDFARLVKPVYPDPGNDDRPCRIRVEAKGCGVEGLAVGPDRPACFAGVETRAPTARASPEFPVPLFRVTVMAGNRNRSLGDLPAGATLPSSVDEDEPAPQDADFRALGLRFVSPDCVFGWLDDKEGPAHDVRSPDLADARERPRFLVQHR
jgi:hypothetical protein